MLADVTGYVATLLGVAFIWPQVVRAYRHDTVEGLAPLGQVIGMMATVLWGVYGYATDRLPAVVSNINMILAIGCLLAIMVRHRVLRARVPIVGFVVTTYVAVMVGRESPEAVGVAAVVVGTPSIIPQVWRVLRSDRLYGVSIPSNVLLMVMCATWFAYGVLERDWILIGPNLVVVPCAAVITMRAMISQRPAAMTETASS